MASHIPSIPRPQVPFQNIPQSALPIHPHTAHNMVIVANHARSVANRTGVVAGVGPVLHIVVPIPVNSRSIPANAFGPRIIVRPIPILMLMENESSEAVQSQS